jgi:hypothetical protein
MWLNSAQEQLIQSIIRPAALFFIFAGEFTPCAQRGEWQKLQFPYQFRKMTREPLGSAARPSRQKRI